MFPFMLSRCCRWISTSRVCLVRKQKNSKYSREFTKSKWSFSFLWRNSYQLSYTGTLSRRCLKVNAKNYLYLPHVVTLALVRIEECTRHRWHSSALCSWQKEKKWLKTVDRFSWKISENFTFFVLKIVVRCWTRLFVVWHSHMIERLDLPTTSRSNRSCQVRLNATSSLSASVASWPNGK